MEVLMKLRGGQDTEVYSQVRGRTSKSCDGRQKLRGGQQEAEGREVTASRMRHALPEAVIHLHTDYVIPKCVDQLCTGRACERFPYLFVIEPDRHLLSLCIIGHRGRRGGV